MRDMLGTVGSFLLSLVGLIAVGALIYEGYGWYRTGEAVQDLSTLVTSIQAAYANEPSFTTLNNTAANSNAWTPKAWDAGGGSITNQWGGTVTVSVDGTNPAEFDVVVAGVPSSGCSKMAQGMSNVESETINGTAITQPVDAATAGTACATASNSLTFVLGH